MPDPNSYQAIGWLLVALGALATAINQGKSLFKSPANPEPTRITNDPMNVHIEKEWATAEEVESLRVEVRALSQQLSSLPAQMAHASEERLKSLHSRIDDCQRSIQAMPAQIVQILANTGAIKK